MIRPLRRRHRWLVPALLAIVFMAALIALSMPAPLPRVDALPKAIVDLQGPQQ
jgi:hypothetical protein